MRGAVTILAVMLAGCGGSPAAAPTQPSPAASTPGPTPTPTSWTISGRILSAPAGAAIAGATILFGDTTATSDAAGSYSFGITDDSTRSLTISAAGYLTRETSMAGGAARTRADFDVIGADPDFPREQYLHLVRNAYQGPNKHEPSRRWTTNPNVYIDTRWRGPDNRFTGGEISPESLAFLTSEIRRLVPQWSGGTLQAGVIESGPVERPMTPGWINVQHGVSGNWSRLGEDPGQVQFGSEGTCQSLAIFHEFGHALGYWHSSVRPSIMGGGPGRCEPYDLTPNEALIARVMYSRAPGNMEPDKDGGTPPSVPPYPLLARPSQPPIVVRCDGLLR